MTLHRGYAYSSGMDIDQRIEALVQSVELLASLHKDNEKRMKRLGNFIHSLGQFVLDHEYRLRQLEDDNDFDDEPEAQ